MARTLNNGRQRIREKAVGEHSNEQSLPERGVRGKQFYTPGLFSKTYNLGMNNQELKRQYSQFSGCQVWMTSDKYFLSCFGFHNHGSSSLMSLGRTSAVAGLRRHCLLPAIYNPFSGSQDSRLCMHNTTFGNLFTTCWRNLLSNCFTRDWKRKYGLAETSELFKFTCCESQGSIYFIRRASSEVMCDKVRLHRYCGTTTSSVIR